MNNNYIGVDLDLFRQPAIQRLEVKHGKGAVAIYLQICFKLSEHEGVLPLSDTTVFSREFFCKEELIKDIINFTDLFKIEGDFFSCGWVTDRVNLLKMKSEKARQSVLSRWSNKQSNNERNTNDIRTYNERNTTKLNKTKKNKKENKKKKFDSKKYILELAERNEISQEVVQPMLDWVELRDEKKAITTQKALDLAVIRIQKSKNPVGMIEKSILNGWTGLFEDNKFEKKEVKRPYPGDYETEQEFYEDIERLKQEGFIVEPYPVTFSDESRWSPDKSPISNVESSVQSIKDAISAKLKHV